MRLQPLLIGLQGDLGSGKTTWTRGLLRGLGHTGPVPSPTYTLLEDYALGGLTVTHLDLYRLAEASEIEHLGLRDRLGEDDTWMLIEWPERAPALAALCDLTVQLEIVGPAARQVRFEPHSATGRRAVVAISEHKP
jgi:tRNA threonylcarbamoyladenosine biosynthesis protein TsaE